MTCASCARKIVEEVNRDPAPFILKGILYAFFAACAGGVLHSVFEGLMSLGGDAAGILGMFFRWTVFVMIATMIVKAAKAGSKGRGNFALQAASTVFYYLAISLAYVPIIFANSSKLHWNLKNILVVSFVSLGLPFTSILRNPLSITGLLAILFCMATVWKGTAASPNPVDGPFDVAPDGVEPNFFKRKAPQPPLPSPPSQG